MTKAMVEKYFRPGQACTREAYIDVAVEVLSAFVDYLRAEEPYAGSTIAAAEEVAESLANWVEEE